MNKKINFFGIHFFFLLSGIFILILCLLSPGSAIDIDIRGNSRYIFDLFTFGIAVFIFHFIFFIAYYAIRNYRNFFLALLHLLTSFGFFIFCIAYTVFINDLSGVPRRYYENSSVSVHWYFAMMFGILFIIGQLLFGINLIFSVKKMRQHKR